MNNINHSTINIKNKLNLENWFIWSNEIAEYLNIFGEAGKEIRNEKKFDQEAPMRSMSVAERFIDASGNVSHMERPWSSQLDEPGFQRRTADYEIEVKRLNENRAKLWVFLVSNSTDNVLQRVQRNRTTYDLLQTSSDCLSLWSLLRQTNHDSGANTTSSIRTRFHALRQVNPVTNKVLPIRDFLLEFDGLASLLQNTTSAVTDHDKIEQLIEAIHSTRYDNVITALVTKTTDMDYISLKDALIRLEDRLEKNTRIPTLLESTKGMKTIPMSSDTNKVFRKPSEKAAKNFPQITGETGNITDLFKLWINRSLQPRLSKTKGHMQFLPQRRSL